MRCLLILLLILGNVTEGAAVEIPTVDPAADRELAKQHYESGKDAFTEGRFATAMLEFEAAYKLSKEPLLIENMAITAEKMGDTANAIALSRKFLTLAPKDGDAEAVATATKRIERLTVPERTPQAVAPAPTPTPAPAAARRPGPSTIAASITISLGGALLIGSLGTAIAGGTLAARFESTPLTLPAYEDTLSQGRGLNIAAGTLLGLGLAAGAGGVVWLVIDRRRHR